MAEVKLLPCPFCGSHNVGMFFRVEKGAVRYVDGIKKNKLLYYASCKDCRCKGGCSISYVALHEYDREADKGQLVAAAIWNQRKPMERALKQLEREAVYLNIESNVKFVELREACAAVRGGDEK